MSKAMIYVVQQGPVEVADGGIIPLGTTIHRFGQNIRQDGNTVAVRNLQDKCGYYLIDVSANLEAAAAAPVTVTVQKNGTDIIGAEVTLVSPAATLLPFPVPPTVVRLEGPGAVGSISVKVTGADVKVENMTVRIVKA